MGYYFLFSSCQKARHILTDNHIKRGTKKRGLDTIRKNYIREKGFIIEETWEFSWGDEIENNVDKKNHIGKNYLFKRSFPFGSILQQNETETIFSYVECNLNVPDEINAKFSTAPSIQKH